MRWRFGVLVLVRFCASARLLAAQCPDGSPPPCAGARAPLPLVVVAPFENRSRDTADSYIASTLSEDITASLQRTRTVRLLSPRAARNAAQYLVRGSVTRTAGMMHVAARLERAGGGEILWITTMDRPLTGSAEVADLIAADVVSHIGGRAGTARAAVPARPIDPQAWDLYLRARFYWNRHTEAGVARAVELYRQAVSRDSTFAQGWAGLSTALHIASVWRLPVPGIPDDSVIGRELEASERAILNDSARAESWLARAWAAEDVDPTSRSTVIRAQRRAIALDSLNADAWNDLGLALVEGGDTVSAVAAARRAIALNPGEPRILTTLALAFYWQRQYDSAAAWADTIIGVDPTFLSGRRIAGTVALARGRWEEAAAQFGAARAVGPGPERIWALAGLAVVAAARGDTATARQLVTEAESLTAPANPALHSAVFLAWAYVALGQSARALDWLERFRPAGDLHFQRHLRGDAPLDPLRGEPRFRALLVETR